MVISISLFDKDIKTIDKVDEIENAFLSKVLINFKTK
jgi:hypothetical protein